MEEEVIERRELAFRYIYSEEIQQQNSKAGVKLFLDANEIDDQRKREYVFKGRDCTPQRTAQIK